MTRLLPNLEIAMGAAEYRTTRISTAKVLLIEHGPTMTVAQVKGHFMPNLTDKAVRNRVSRGDLPPTRDGMFDTQQIGDWWDSHCTATARVAA